MSRSLAAFTLCVLTSATAFAQNVRTPVAPEPFMPGQADMMKLQTAMITAQQAAIKPGDETLPCEALQKELVSSMNNPAIQAYAAKTDAAYAREIASQQKKGEMTAATAAALAASLTSGAAMTGMPQLPQFTPGQQMTPQQMQQVMLAQQQASIAYMNQLAPIMPALMRGQRVTMLAGMKNCAWATGGLGLYPNVTVPTVPRQK